MTVSRDSIDDIWGERTPHENSQWPVRVDQRTLEEPEAWVQSACVLCSNGCGLDIGVKEGRIVGVRGRAEDVVNKGRLGPKGLHGWEANNSLDRLTQPLIRREGELVPASWDEAMDLIVGQTKSLQEQFTSSTIGFYTSGQLFLEEYYTLAVIGKAGLGTPHMDGNTRLCTATAAAALKETFGSDGQPGSYFDLDTADTIFMVGHNMAETDTVLWMRILDRRSAPNPPKLIVVDPRATATAQEADIHIAPKVGTNVALLNGLLNLIIQSGQVDQEYIEAHTVGFEDLKTTVSTYTPEHVEGITGVAQSELRAAAETLGKAERLVSSVLQGVYQSNQATVAAVQVNNINLIRGMIGRPGCGVLQMNGQPTAQNTRETGADGDLPGFRNWNNPDHIQELADIWNVDKAKIPHWAPPTHAMNIFHLVEESSIRMLWVSGTNPAVSLPDLGRVRKTLADEKLFLVVQDAFLNETAEFADVVLPAALWGEKTGCFTNVDRTVHLSQKAVEPPGEARSDFDIFLDFARKMDLRDKDNQPLIKWQTPEEAFEGWKACSRGRPCDYSGLSYAKLSGGSGIPWPCNSEHPDGLHQLYEDSVFPTAFSECESFGHDLVTGGAVEPVEFKAMEPAGRAILKSAEYAPHAESPDEEYPFWLSTGRQVYHFHTRTKTGRSPELRKKAPEAFAQLHAEDAASIGVSEGEMVKVSSRRGIGMAPARIGEIQRGHVFMPFHYGYWDEVYNGRPRAANELTFYDWDPVSKQPTFKYAAVRIEKATPADLSGWSTALSEDGDTGAGSSKGKIRSRIRKGILDALSTGEDNVSESETQNEKTAPSHMAEYLGLLEHNEKRLIRALKSVRQVHGNVPDITVETGLFIAWAEQTLELLGPFVEKYGERELDKGKIEALDRALNPGREGGGFALVRDLQDLWLLVNESMISGIMLMQAAQALRDVDLEEALGTIKTLNQRQRAWLLTRLKQSAPQSLVVPR